LIPPMSTHDNLASLPPATLRAALEASEKRIRREKEKVQKEIQKLQKRLREIEEGENAPTLEIGPGQIAETNVAGGSKPKRPRVDIADPCGEGEVDETHTRRPIVSVRRVDPGSVSPQRSCTKCRKRGIRCEWDEKSTSRRCLSCQRLKAGCDLKRPTPGTR